MKDDSFDSDIFDEEIEQNLPEQEIQTKEQSEKPKGEIKNIDTSHATKAQHQTQEIDDGSVKLSKEEYESFRQMQHENELARVDREFKKEYPDFDIKKVTDKILELDDKNPGIGQRLLTHEGIENVYLKYFAGKSEEADEFDASRGLGGGISMSERIEAINKGAASDDERLELYAKFL